MRYTKLLNTKQCIVYFCILIYILNKCVLFVLINDNNFFRKLVFIKYLDSIFKYIDIATVHIRIKLFN